MRVNIHVQGPWKIVIRVMTELGAAVWDRGGEMVMDDRRNVMRGNGWVGIELPAEDLTEAVATVRAILETTPEADRISVGGDLA